MQIKLTPAFVVKAAAVDPDGKPVERAIFWDTEMKDSVLWSRRMDIAASSCNTASVGARTE
jgi:hypothetical protein